MKTWSQNGHALLTGSTDNIPRERRQMTEMRRFRRITYEVGGTLQCRDATFRCRLENLSMGGALVTIRDAAVTGLHTGDTCVLRLYHEIEGRYITVEALIAHHAFSIAGLGFPSLDTETATSLETIMEREKRKAPDMDYNALYYSSFGNAERCSP
jgi:c-di-GMP-binding flagellar brake protein YcgR